MGNRKGGAAIAGWQKYAGSAAFYAQKYGADHGRAWPYFLCFREGTLYVCADKQ